MARRAVPQGCLIITTAPCRFFDATQLWGETVGQTTDILENQYGTDIDVAAIRRRTPSALRQYRE
jgi:aldehyde:ferredoxin oxidoreductase